MKCVLARAWRSRHAVQRPDRSFIPIAAVGMSNQYTAMLTKYGFVYSMSRKGTAGIMPLLNASP
jgi:hypothetical protein